MRDFIGFSAALRLEYTPKIINKEKTGHKEINFFIINLEEFIGILFQKSCAKAIEWNHTAWADKFVCFLMIAQNMTDVLTQVAFNILTEFLNTHGNPLEAQRL